MPDQSPAPPMTDDPIRLFSEWLDEARLSESEDPDAACVATVDDDGMPNARMVLVRRVDDRGFVFFTNYESRKGREMTSRPKAALCFHWKSLRRQVRVRGKVEKTSAEESDSYFASRLRGSQISAWASLQSSPLPSRETFAGRVRDAEQKFSSQSSVSRPGHWGGFRVIPERIEFWQQKEFRTHERLVYTRENNQWQTGFLYP